MIEQCRAEGICVISVDTKKKELIGRFASPGTIWCKKPIKVNDHDFPSYARFKAVPYGIFDLLNNRGTVGVGDSSDTPEFAVDCIVHWFEHGGRHLYPHAKRLVILADCGGSNNYRARAWKYLLQTKLCDPYQLPITVAHYPSGASKWNPIEHRLFGPVTINISGRPLDTEETFMNYISTTTNQSGLCVTAVRVTKQYQKGMEITDEQMATINLTHNKINPKWNYDIQPRESLDSAELPTDP